MLMKKVGFASLLTVFIFSTLLNINVLGSNSSDTIRVFLQGKRINFDVEPKIVSGRTIVPLRAIFEALGAEVNWNDRTKTVIAMHGSNVINIKIGSKKAYINYEAIELDVPAVIYDGRTLVPVRFISESFGYEVEWDASTRTVRINSKTSLPTAKITLTPKSTPTSIVTPTFIKPANFSGNIDCLMGLSLSDITGIFGEPDRIDLSRYGFDWYIYNSDYLKYIQIGVENGVVVGVYTNCTYYSVWESIKVLSAKSSVKDLLGTPLTYIQKGRVRYTIDSSGGYEVFDVDGEYYATVFYDTQNDSKVSAVMLVEREAEMSLSGYYGKPDERLRQSYEREIFDLANSVRARLGMKLLEWDDKAASAARKHSEDMALNNYFSHTNLEGKSPFDRMEDVGIKYIMASENIAMGQMDGIYAHETWMNSSGHRSNILGNCAKLGVGVYIGSGNKIYYTQNFYTGYN